jgi:AbrB family looped-hinge helix DNA binding protein
LESKISSKAQVVLPKALRDKLGLKPGDRVRFEIVDGKALLLRPASKPPQAVFVKAGEKIVDAVLKERRRVDEDKIRRLLAELGVRA